MKAKEILEQQAKNNKFVHAYLIEGNDTEKTEELIDYIIKQKGCLENDISILKPAENTGKTGEIKVEDIRLMLHDLSLTPHGKCRIAIIYNSEKLNKSSGNILLKSLEEPPSTVTFILVAKNGFILETIKSRCQTLTTPSLPSTLAGKYEDLLKMNFMQASKKIEELVKKEEVGDFLNYFENYFREEMLCKKSSLSVRYLRALSNARLKIEANANPRLALECLSLKWKEINVTE